MNAEHIRDRLALARARAQGPDAGERAIGSALVAYYEVILRQYEPKATVEIPDSAMFEEPACEHFWVKTRESKDGMMTEYRCRRCPKVIVQ